MKIFFIILVSVVALYALFEVVRIAWILSRAQTGILYASTAYTRPSGVKHVLVAGDSTAVGIGASTPAESLPARLAREVDASVANFAKNGARAKDVAGQLALVERSSYDLILIQVGANDVIYFHSLKSAVHSAEEFLDKARSMSDRVALFTSGKIGEAPLVPYVLRPVLTSRADSLRKDFKALAGSKGVLYVDLFAEAEKFEKQDYSADLLHPSDSGYGQWLEIVTEKMRERWPELFHDTR